MTGLTFLEQFASQYLWAQAPAKRRFRFRKCVNRGMEEEHRLALTLGGVIDRALDDDEGLQSSDYSTYQIFEENDLVFKLIDLENIKTSRVGYVPRRGIMSPAYIRLQPASEFTNSKYYYWFFFAVYINNIFNGMGGGVRQNLTPTDLLEFPLPLPDLPTQRAIADFLDRETARIDQLIEKKLRLVQLLNAAQVAAPLRVIKSGIGEIEYDAERNRVAFSNLAEGWQRVRVKQVACHMTSGSRGWSDFIQDEGELFLQSGSIDRHMGISFEASHRVSPQSGAEAERTKVRNGDTLVCITGGRTGAVGYVSGLSERAYINQHVCLIRPSTAINDRLLAQILFSEIGQLHFQMAQYGLKQGMGFEQVANTAIPLPPREAQDEISAEIDRLTAKARRVIDRIGSSIDRLREFRSALITAAVTGQIDVETWGRRELTDRRLDRIEEAMRA